MKLKPLLFLALLATFRCVASPEREVTTPIPNLKDSHKRLSDLAKFYWIDDRRILFEGMNGKEIIRPDGYKVLMQSLFLWDVQNGELAEKAEIAGGLCYADGYVQYRKWDSEEKGAKAGDIVAGLLDGDLASRPDLAGVLIDPRTCRPKMEEALPNWSADKSIRRLSKHHGLLVLGPAKEGRNTPVTYHPNGEVQGILMPFKRREARLGTVEYFGFKGAYFIQGDYFVSVPQHPDGGYNRSPWPPGMPIPVWWLYPDGRVDSVRLPSDAREGSWIFPAKNGFYFVSHRFPTRDGLYQILSLTKPATRIIKGAITRYSVSPTGCSIALNHDGDYHGTRGRGTLKIIKVCLSGD